jgi:hypothetical protein
MADLVDIFQRLPRRAWSGLRSRRAGSSFPDALTGLW